METRTLFFQGDHLSLSSKTEGSVNLPVKVEQADPMIVEVLEALSEATINKLNSGNELIISDPKRGFAYVCKAMGVSGGKVTISLLERHESRKYFRAETMLMMGYDIIRAAPGQTLGEKKAEDSDIQALLEKLDGAGEFEKSMASLVFSMYDELRQLRQQMQCDSSSTNSKISQRLVNLSGSGLRFTADQQHQVGELLQLHLVLPTSARPIVCTAKIVRVDTELSSTPGLRLGVACTFDEIADSDREAIIRFVFQAQRKANKKGF